MECMQDTLPSFFRTLVEEILETACVNVQDDFLSEFPYHPYELGISVERSVCCRVQVHDTDVPVHTQTKKNPNV